MIIRGVFLVGVLALYSTSVWKMIDGFFKDRFQNYLEEEFKKNPKMRDDLNAYAAIKAGKRGNDFINTGNFKSAPNGNQRQMDESQESGPRSVDILTTAASFLESVEQTRESGENRVTTTVDNNAFQESHMMQAMRKERPNTAGSNEFREQSLAQRRREKAKRAKEKIGKQQQSEKIGKDASHDLREMRDEIRGREKREARNKREEIDKREKRSILESEINKGGSKKRKYSPITFTEDDFKSAKRSIDDDDDDDFSEFDLEDEKKVEQRREGILVSELPFKPKFDISDLEFITADEFCPLTLEDEATCGITNKWP